MSVNPQKPIIRRKKGEPKKAAPNEPSVVPAAVVRIMMPSYSIIRKGRL